MLSGKTPEEIARRIRNRHFAIWTAKRGELEHDIASAITQARELPPGMTPKRLRQIADHANEIDDAELRRWADWLDLRGKDQ